MDELLLLFLETWVVLATILATRADLEGTCAFAAALDGMLSEGSFFGCFWSSCFVETGIDVTETASAAGLLNLFAMALVLFVFTLLLVKLAFRLFTLLWGSLGTTLTATLFACVRPPPNLNGVLLVGAATLALMCC